MSKNKSYMAKKVLVNCQCCWPTSRCFSMAVLEIQAHLSKTELFTVKQHLFVAVPVCIQDNCDVLAQPLRLRGTSKITLAEIIFSFLRSCGVQVLTACLKKLLNALLMLLVTQSFYFPSMYKKLNVAIQHDNVSWAHYPEKTLAQKKPIQVQLIEASFIFLLSSNTGIW